MTTWQRSAPSNQTIPIHQHNHLQDEDSLSNLPGLPVEETLDSQEEAEEAEEVEEVASLMQLQHNK